MNDTEGIVVRLDGDHAWVSPRNEGGACGGCSQKSGCGMRSSDDQRQPLLRLPNPIRARAGDSVIIHAADGFLLCVVWRIYGIPLLLALAGAMAGLIFTDSDGGALAGMMLGLAAGFFSLHRRPGLSVDQPAAMRISLKKP